MHTLAQTGTQRLEQPVVAEPAVGHHQHRGLCEEAAQACDQLHRLRKLVREYQRLAAQTDARGAQRLAAQVEPKGQGDTAPTPVDGLEQTNRDDPLRPGPGRLVALGRMVERPLTGDDLLAGFRIDRIVQPQQQTPGDQGAWDRAPQRFHTPSHGSFTEAMKVYNAIGQC
jgi:hypothetical protein